MTRASCSDSSEAAEEVTELRVTANVTGVEEYVIAILRHVVFQRSGSSDGWHVQPPQGRRASFRIPGRRLYLYTAPLTAAAERFPSADPLLTHSPNLWWPADQAWCVATEIDLTCTYVGCSNVAEHDIVNSPLAAYSVAPDDPVSVGADPSSP